MNYICVYYDTKDDKWYHSKRVKKKEAEYLLHELLNFDNENISEVYILKIMKGELCDRNFIH